MLIPGYSRSQAYYICLRCNLDVLTSLASRMLKKKTIRGLVGYPHLRTGVHPFCVMLSARLRGAVSHHPGGP